MKKLILTCLLVFIAIKAFAQQDVTIDRLILMDDDRQKPIMFIDNLNMIDVKVLNASDTVNLSIFIVKSNNLGSVHVEIGNPDGLVYEVKMCCHPFLLQLPKKLFTEDNAYYINITPVSGPCVGIKGVTRTVYLKLLNYR